MQDSGGQAGDRVLARVVAATVAVLGFLPLVTWMDAGPTAPWYPDAVRAWTLGSVIVVGFGIVGGMLSRRGGWVDLGGALDPLAGVWRARALACIAAATLMAFGLYAFIARNVFSGHPLHIDEIAQVFQANTFLGGALWRPQPPHPEFFSFLHIIDFGGRVYSQFPPGGPAAIALATALGGGWLTGPIFGALSVAAFAAYQRVAEPNPGLAAGSVLLFALTPFVAFMAGTEMNHVATVTCLLVAVAALARVMRATTEEGGRTKAEERTGARRTKAENTTRPPATLKEIGFAALSGLGFGAAATVRPVNALAFALPAGAWFLARAVRDPRRWQEAIAAAAGVAIPIALLLAYNTATTGSPLVFGYDVLWGKAHSLGFHAAPWGDTHTPARGLALISGYFLRLQAYVFESPLPALLPLIVALAIAPRLTALDRYWLAASALLVGLYFAYWHDGIYLGPRFMYPLAPWIILWTARLPGLVRERFGAGQIAAGVRWGYAAAFAGTAVFGIPARWHEYAGALASTRMDVASAERAQNVQGALVFVRESWAAQLVARLWADGVSRPDAEALMGRIDACELDQALGSLEALGVSGENATAALRDLTKDSASLLPSPLSPDKTERMRPGANYGPVCVQRVQEDRTGFTLLAPALLLRGTSNIYARDLHERNLSLAEQYPDRPIYLMLPGATPSAPPTFRLLPRDSAVASWHSP